MTREAIEGRKGVIQTGTRLKYESDSRQYIYGDRINEHTRAEEVDFESIRAYLQEGGLNLSDEVTLPLGLNDLKWHLLLPNEGDVRDLIFVGTTMETIVSNPEQAMDNAVGTIVVKRSNNRHGKVTPTVLRLAGTKHDRVLEAQFDFFTGACKGLGVSLTESEWQKITDLAEGKDNYYLRHGRVNDFIQNNVGQIPQTEEYFDHNRALVLPAMARRVTHSRIIETYSPYTTGLLKPKFTGFDVATSLGLSIGESSVENQDKAEIISDGKILPKLKLSLPLYIGTKPIEVSRGGFN